jgi:hypothetical protein
MATNKPGDDEPAPISLGEFMWEIDKPTFVAEFWRPHVGWTEKNPAFRSRAYEVPGHDVLAALAWCESNREREETVVLYLAVDSSTQGNGLIRLLGVAPTETV